MRFRRWCLVALVVCAASARAATFVVKPGKSTEVVFTSRAPTETLEGRTDRMEGRLDVDPSGVGDSVTVHFEVDLASLDTGSKMRNKHMRENHLETAKFPKAVFDGAAVLSPAGAKLEAGKPVTFEAEGTFTVHGVSRRLRCTAEVTLSGGALAFKASFPVTLEDHAIKRPEILFLKLAETQQVRVSATATPAPPN